jgi:hypothetical protein
MMDEKLEELRQMLPSGEVMLFWCAGRWSTGTLLQAPSTIEIGENLSSGRTPSEAVEHAIRNVKEAQRE